MKHTENDTHTICDKRLNQKGENLCCFCSPHSHCEWASIVKEVSTPSVTESETNSVIPDNYPSKTEEVEDWVEIVNNWLKEEKTDCNYVEDYDGEYDLDSCTLDGSFNLRELCERVISFNTERVKKLIKSMNHEYYPINVEKQDEKWNYINGYNQALKDILNRI